MCIRKPALAGVFALALLTLPGCGAITASQGPEAQQAIDTGAASISTRIVKACLGSGLFKMASGFALAALPGGSLPKAALDAGVDMVCANPDRFAHDASTVVWVAKNLKDIAR